MYPQNDSTFYPIAVTLSFPSHFCNPNPSMPIAAREDALLSPDTECGRKCGPAIRRPRTTLVLDVGSPTGGREGGNFVGMRLLEAVSRVASCCADGAGWHGGLGRGKRKGKREEGGGGEVDASLHATAVVQAPSYDVKDAE